MNNESRERKLKFEYSSNVIKHDNTEPHTVEYRSGKRLRSCQPTQQPRSVSPLRYNDTYRSSFDLGCHQTFDAIKIAKNPLTQEIALSQLLASLNFDHAIDRQHAQAIKYTV